jgi:hypothetical protein
MNGLTNMEQGGNKKMERTRGHKKRDKNKSSLPQVPKEVKYETDGVYEEYSEELADQADREAQARANAANQRQTRKPFKKG